ncbi:PilZ domain-containing protein [Hyphomonas sp. NPDC076900]|uniref:PilZ domain-containing protein n=1 Tax=unclassified Hyphomonas TaxID=2630699 RepID=UPI003D06F606
MVFGKKSGTPISPERLSAALRTNTPADHTKLIRRRPRADRQSTWAPCVLVWEPKGREEGVCIDISESGARIRFRNKVMLPGKFFFVSAKLGINTPAEFIRQDGHDIAIRFTS